MKIAITGGIGSGKSYICHLLQQYGIEIFYCDEEAKRIMVDHPKVREELVALIGPEVYTTDSDSIQLNKVVLGTFLRANPENTAKVNAIVHPRVAEAFLESGKNWMECAILKESGFQHLVDKIVVVTCPLEERYRRIMERDHCNRETVERWLSMQISDEERLKMADFIIVNDSVNPLLPQITELLSLEADEQNTVMSQTIQGGATSFPYAGEKFADIQMLRYKVEGFENLNLQQKTYIFHLTEAALAGRDILFDQNGKYNLRLRRMLEAVYVSLKDTSEDAESFKIYMKRFWFSSGIHHHYGCEKFQPGFSEKWLREVLTFIDYPIDEELLRVIFDPCIDPIRCNQRENEDLLLTSASNYYEDGITQAEAEEYYSHLRANTSYRKDCPPLFGLNSRLERTQDGSLQENVYRIGELYGPAIQEIVRHLEEALPFAENDKQREVIRLLIDFYNTGNLTTFDNYCIAWLEDTTSLIDFVNGFTETYGDPLGYKASWESIVNFKDLVATQRTETMATNAQWFEDHSPVDSRFKKSECRGISAKVITGAIITGDLYPSTAIGINLPNSDWVRRDHGSKSVTIGNFTDAYNKASRGSGMMEEFVIDEDTRKLILTYGDICDDLHTDLHECLGHGSGQLLPGVSSDALKAYSSTIEEARADLFGLYYIADEKLVELGLTPNNEAYKSQYYTYMMNGLLTQLVRILPGATIEEAHMRNRALIAHWVLEQPGNAMELVSIKGKTYLRINDYDAIRHHIGELLAEIQRIKSEGDYEAARHLVEDYGVQINAELHQEILARYKKLELKPYKGFINPRYTAIRDSQGEITEVNISYSEEFDEQSLRYSREYNFLPDIN